MKIENGKFPPNFPQIKQTLGYYEGNIYPFGDIIYNPKGDEIPPDVIFHEEVHKGQQSIYSSPLMWWTKYLLDKQFRQEQEVEACSKQYLFVKNTLGSKVAKECLDECAENLSHKRYKLNLTFHQAHTLIRKSI